MTYRVLLTTDTLVHDGAERQFALTATHLPPDWDVRCFSVDGGPFEDYLRSRGVWLRVTGRVGHYDPLPFLRLWGLAARWRPHVVHSWGYMTTLAGFPAFRALGIPFVDATIRTGDLDLYRDSRRTTGMDKATLVAANTRCGLDAAGIAPERARVVPNGFDFSRIPAAPPERRDPRFTVVMTGRMDGVKDYPAFIEAARLLAAEVGTGGAARDGAEPGGAGGRSPAGLRFIALGKGPEQARLEEEARDLVESGMLEFGYTADVIPQLMTADCGVLLTTPPTIEGCSNSILEYMTCGLPVVASRGGGTDELVADGDTGFLVAPGDAAGLADRLRRIYTDREEARRMGEQGARLVRERHSLEAMVHATVDLYLEAMTLGRRR